MKRRPDPSVYAARWAAILTWFAAIVALLVGLYRGVVWAGFMALGVLGVVAFVMWGVSRDYEGKGRR